MRRFMLNFAAVRNAEAATAVVRLGEESREMFRHHLLRLDHRTRSQRFGACGLHDDFLESYSRNINFSNTAVFSLLAGQRIRASAELRSLSANWERQAELAVNFEPGWKRGSEALCREVFRLATQLGLLELYTYCDLATECIHTFLRFLDKERLYATCECLMVLEPMSPGDGDACSDVTSNALLRVVPATAASRSCR